MTEIPEHLLKRSRERRAAIGKGDDAGDAAAAGDAAPSSSTPATTAATPEPAAPSGPPTRSAPPEPAPPAPPEPDAPYVTAAKSRRKIPFWAMATLSLMPVWGFMYVRAPTDPPETVEGPLGMGAEIYGSCASCHGGDGGGGVGYAFAGGEVLATYPDIEDQLRFVYWGTGEYNLAGIEIAGDPDRPGGPHVTGALGVMPQQGSVAGGDLTDYEILAVVCHERYTLGGADPTSEEYAEEYEQFCSEESPVFTALEAGEIALTDEEPHVFVGPDGEFEMGVVGLPAEGGAVDES